MTKLTTIMLTVLLAVCGITHLHAQVNGDYRTINSGNFNDLSIWETYNSGWAAAVAAPTGTGSITIQAPHTVTMNVSVTLSANKTFSINGTLEFLGTQQISGTSGNAVNINAGSFFKTANPNGFWGASSSIHNSLFNVPISSTSTIEFNRAGAQAVNQFGVMGNVTINVSSGSTVTAAALQMTGTLYMQSGLLNVTGTFQFAQPITGTATNVTVGSGCHISMPATIAAGTFIPSSITSFNILTLGNSTNPVELNGNITIAQAYLSGGKCNNNGYYVHITSATNNNFAGSYFMGAVRRTIPAASTTTYFPVGGSTQQSVNITAQASNSATVLEVTPFETTPTGTPDGTTCNGVMLNRHAVLKVIGASSITNISQVSFTASAATPTLNAQCRLAFSLDDSPLSYNGRGGIVTGTTVTSSRALTTAQRSDLTSSDGMFMGIASLPGTPMPAGKYCIGPAASYTPPSGAAYINAATPYVSMNAALLDLNDFGVAGNSYFEFQNDYSGTVETLPVSIYYQGTVTTQAEFRIREDFTGTHAIGGYMDGPDFINAIIKFNNCRYVTLNGTKNNTPGTRGLRIYNTCTSFCNPIAITILNDALNNSVIGCRLEANSSCISSSTLTGTTGSDFTTIQYCKMTQYTNVNGTTFGYHVYESGLSTCKINDVKILDNEFENLARPVIAQNAINGNWEVSRNHVYVTGTIPGLHFPFTISSTDPSIFIIVENNYIGGNAPYAQGARALTYTAPLFYIYALGTNTHRINGNTIRNIKPNSTGIFNIIDVYATSSCQINNNLLGDSTVANAVDFTTSEPINLRFIYYNNYGTGAIASQINNNMMANIRFQSTSHTGIHQFFYVNDNATGTGSYSVNNNTIKNIADAGATGYQCFYLFNGGGSTRTLTANGNVIESISRPQNAGINQVFHGFYSQYFNATFNGNRIGKWNTPNDMVIGTPNENYCYNSPYVSQMVHFTNDTIANVNFTNPSSNNSTCGIYAGGGSAGSKLVNGNVIQNLSSATNRVMTEATTISSPYPLAGIIMFGAGSNNQVNNNKIDGLSATSTTATNVGVIGIDLSGGNATVNNNTIYNLTNSATGTVTQPFIAGIRFMAGATLLASNNMISISNGTNTNAVRIYGMYANQSATYNTYFNTITIGGSSAGIARSAAYWKYTFGNFDLRNNIFHNNRTGGTLNYAIVNENGSGTGGGWTYLSNYNNIYSASAATTGAWPLATPKTFAQWQAVSGDANSKNTDVRFVNSSNNLHMATTTNCNLDIEGTVIAGITLDIDGDIRHISTPSIGADEFTYNPNWATASSNSIVCSPPQNLNLAVTDNTYGAHTYQWSGPNGYTSTNAAPVVTSPTAALHTGNYTATVTDVLSCASTPTTTAVTIYEPPVLSCPSNVSQSNDAGACGAVVTYPAATATGVPIPTIYYSHPSGSFFPVGTTTVTVSAANYCDSVTCTFTVTVADNELPVISNCPANININSLPTLCSNTATWTAPTSADNCAIQSFTGTHNSGDMFPVGTTTVTYTATDIHSNVQTCSFTVTVTDNTPPVISNCPTNISVNNDAGLCSAIVSWTAPTATDNCGVQSLTSSHNSGAAFPVGTTTVIYTATDVNGNVQTCSFTVTVTDTEQPVISNCPTTISVNTDTGLCSAVVTWTAPIATDNCNIQTFTSSHNSGSVFAEGLTTVSYTATDINGNVQTCTFTVTVTDNELPVISNCPADININTASALCNAVAVWTAPTANDNCGIQTFTSTHNSGSTFPVGTTTVTYTATDVHGNVQTCSFDVIVTDSELPTILCPASIVTCNPSPVLGTPGVSDNCDVDTVYSNAPIVFPQGLTTVTWTVEDVHGNVNTCQQNVTIQSSNSLTADSIISSSGNNICKGNGTTLFVSGGMLGGGDSWQWYSGSCGGTPVGTGNSIVVSPVATTTYFVRAEGACGNTMCVFITITVSNGKPSQSVVVPIVGLPNYACNGTAATISVPAVANATQYTWDGPIGTTFDGMPSPYVTTMPSVNIVFGNPNGSGYRIGVQAGNGCGSSARKSEWVRGIVSTPAAVSGATTTCASSGGTYTTNSSDGATSYLWTISGDATVVGTDTNVTVNFGPSWTGGTLCVRSQTPCYTSPAKCLVIGPSASPLNTISGPLSACPNDVLNFSVPASNGAASYQWTVPANSSITGGAGTNSIQVTFAPGYNNLGNICVNVTSVCGVTSANKCRSIAPGVPSVPASITGATNGLCGQSISYSTPFKPGTTYNWTSPGSISGNGSNAVSITYGSFNTGQVCVSASTGCGTSAARCISVKGQPNSPVAITAMPASWCANTQGVEFTVDVSNTSGSYTLSWTYPSAPVATYTAGGGNTNSLILDWGTGNGIVIVSASNSCGTGSKTYVANINCKEGQLAAANKLNVYPNPTAGVLNVEYTADKGNAQVTMLDLSGRVVMTQTHANVTGQNTLQLDLSKVAKGAYMLNVQTNGSNNQVRVVVE